MKSEPEPVRPGLSSSVTKPIRFFLGSGGCMSCLMVAKTTWKLRSCVASLRSSWLRPCEKQHSEFDGELSLVGQHATHSDERSYHEDADIDRSLGPQYAREHYSPVLRKGIRAT